jgi:transposase
MRKVELRMNEEFKYRIIKKLVETNGNKKRAAIQLGRSLRQINRMIAGYNEKGKEFFMHGNRGRKPCHAFTEDEKDEIEQIYLNKYWDCTYTAFSEFLALNEQIYISVDEARTILRDRYIFSPRTHKCTKKRLKKQLILEQRRAKTKSERSNIQEKMVSLEDAHPRQPRCQYFGEELQMDACIHLWFGNIKTALHAAIDDATGNIVGLYFDNQETLNGYYHTTHQILNKYGIPYKIKTDKRTVFEYKKKASSLVEEDTFTQYAYACKQLGIQIETSSVPEFKPRIERLFQTLQQRLPQELRLAQITTLSEANIFLIDFMNRYNKKFALCIDNTKSVFEKQVEKEKLNLILAVLTKRVVDKGHSIKFNNKYYRFLNSRSLPIYFNSGTKCIVIKAFDEKLYSTVDNSVFALEEIPEVQSISENFDYIEEVEEKKIYVPKMTHPWRLKSFEEFVQKQEHRLENVS